EAKRRLDESQRIREGRAAESPLALARTLELVGTLHRYSGNYSAAVPAPDGALAIRDRLAPDHPETIFALQTRGDVFLLMGDTNNAQRTWSSALDLGERVLRAGHPATAELLRRLGFSAFSLGNLSEARDRRERALRIGEQSLAPCDPTNAHLANAVGISLLHDGEYSEARKLYRRVLNKVIGR